MTELDWKRLAFDLVVQHLDVGPNNNPRDWAKKVVNAAEEIRPIIRDYLRAKPVPTKM